RVKPCLYHARTRTPFQHGLDGCYTHAPMLDLNYVRENLDKVREALQARHADTAPLDDFARADTERRRVIAESDQLNAQRNTASREIGGLMKEGKKEEAEARRAEVGHLKEQIAEL